jgi:hypothetical protein
MMERAEVVHVHCLDEGRVVEQFRDKGYVLYERTQPSIVAQAGFSRLVFIPSDDVEPICEAKPRNLWETVNSVVERLKGAVLPANPGKT